MAASTDFVADLSKLLECPICFNGLREGRTIQCGKGHTICTTCKGKLTRCPTCEMHFGMSRNFIAEQISSLIPFIAGNNNEARQDYSIYSSVLREIEAIEGVRNSVLPRGRGVSEENNVFGNFDNQFLPAEFANLEIDISSSNLPIYVVPGRLDENIAPWRRGNENGRFLKMAIMDKTAFWWVSLEEGEVADDSETVTITLEKPDNILVNSKLSWSGPLHLFDAKDEDVYKSGNCLTSNRYAFKTVTIPATNDAVQWKTSVSVAVSEPPTNPLTPSPSRPGTSNSENYSSWRSRASSSSYSETSYSAHSSNTSSSSPPAPLAQPKIVHIAVEIRGDEGVGICVIHERRTTTIYYTFGINEMNVNPNEEDCDDHREVKNAVHSIKNFKQYMTQDCKVFIHSTADLSMGGSNTRRSHLDNQLRQLKETRGIRSLEISSCQNVQNRFETRAAFALLNRDEGECENLLENHPISARRAN